MTLLDRFRDHLLQLKLPANSALVAVSGGPDSVTLLDLLVRTWEDHGLSLVVAHLDHGIHPRSADAAELVKRLAAEYRLPFEHGRLELGAEASETIARVHRYEWLEATRVLLGLPYILTAHHADDQVETVLMRALAGSGTAGLAGMAPVQGRLVRPLLPFSRVELLRYLREHGLECWIDPANSDTRHRRSWIRTELLPSLRRSLPEIDARLLRLSSQAAGERAAWDAALTALPGLDVHLEDSAISIAAPPLRTYDSTLSQAVLRALGRKVGCTLGPARLTRVLDLLLRGESGSRAPIGSGWTAELAFGRLRIYRAQGSCPREPWLVDGASGKGVWGHWRFRWELSTAPTQQERSGLSAWFTVAPLLVRAWAPGEKLRPLGGVGRRLVVRCFQEEKVPRSRRGSWPVLTQNDELVWIPGVCRSDLWLPEAGTQALRVDAEYA